MEYYEFSKEKIKNYLVNRSFLHQKSNSLDEVINFYKCLQVDPINVVARNHEMILWNRVENFQKIDLYKALYEERKLFEYWLQLFSIISIQYFPYLKVRMDIKGNWQEEYYKKHHKEVD